MSSTVGAGDIVGIGHSMTATLTVMVVMVMR